MAETRIQTECEGCGATLTFPIKELGTVQECSKCGGYVDVPEIEQTPTIFESQWENYQRQNEQADAQALRYEQQLDETDKQLIKGEQLNDRNEILLDRLDQLLGRWEKISGQVERLIEKLGDNS